MSEKETAFSNDKIKYGFVKKKCETLGSIHALPRQVYDKHRALSKVNKSLYWCHCLFSESDLNLLVSWGKKLIEGGKLTEDRVDKCFGGQMLR